MCRAKRGCCPELDEAGDGYYRLFDKELGDEIVVLNENQVYALTMISKAGLSAWHAIMAQDDPSLHLRSLNVQFKGDMKVVGRMDPRKLNELFRFGIDINGGILQVRDEYEVPSIYYN